jgi:hypothetical protein
LNASIVGLTAFRGMLKIARTNRINGNYFVPKKP